MSKYTTELRYIIDSGFDLGLQDYEVITEEYRERLNNKIKNHYYFHEIGFETAERFKHYLNTTMNEIMPYYNQLLQSELLTINPLLSFEKNSNMTKNFDETIVKDLDSTTNQVISNTTSLDNTTTSSTDETQIKDADTTQDTTINTTKNVDGNNSSSEQDVFYDTPNGSLGDITDSDYATTVNKKTGSNVVDEDEIVNSVEGKTASEDVTTTIDSDTTNTTNTDTTSDTDNDTTVNTDENITNTSLETNVISENGYNIPLSDLLTRYRETFLNVDLQIINELKDLFMLIY